MFPTEAPAPSAIIADGSSDELSRLSDRARGYVEAAIADGSINAGYPIIITVENDNAAITQGDAATLAGGTVSTSVDEINSLLNDGLPAAYLRDEESMSEDKHYAPHLESHWGF